MCFAGLLRRAARKSTGKAGSGAESAISQGGAAG